jgi:high-affinity iron transporter
MTWFEPAAALIGLREGLEAFLVTGILLGVTRRLGARLQAQAVWLGAAAGLAASIVFAFIVQVGLDAWYQRGGALLIEVSTGVVALGILTYMVVWMYRHTMQSMAAMRTKMAGARDSGRWFLVASLAFLVVFREGVEAVLFFAAKAAAGSPWTSLGLSGIAGFAISGLIVIAIFRVAVRVNIQHFFAITGGLLILLSAGVLVGTAGAAEELGAQHALWQASPAAYDARCTFPHESHDANETAEAGCPKPQGETANPLAAVLHTLVGYEDHPTWTQAVAYLAFVLGFGGWYARMVWGTRPSPPSKPVT